MSDGLRMSGYLASQLTNASRKLSGFWNTCPIEALRAGIKDGVYFFDDFTNSMVQAANVAGSATTLADPWCAFTDATAASTIASESEPTGALGAMKLLITTANEGMHIGLMTQKGLGTVIDPGGLSSTNKFWLEARWKVSTIGANEIAAFFGLMEKSRVITLGTIATGGAAVAAVDHVGFLKKGTGTSALGTSTGNGTSTDVNTAFATLVADTYVKTGMTWDGTTLNFYLNGTADSANTLVSTSTQFPATEGLSPHIGAISGSTAGDDIVTFDWVAFAYLRS